MTECLRGSKGRTSTFGSLHAENIGGNTFMKEEVGIFHSDVFDSEIPELDLSDLISKTEDAELPLDIANIQPAANLERSQRVCDVIHQLHGDQQQEQQRNEKALSQNKLQGGFQPNNSIRRLHKQQSLLHHDRKFVDQPYQQSCLPDSPPDSGSEPYSPQQEAQNRFNIPQRNQPFSTNHQSVTSSREYGVDQYRVQNSLSSPSGSSNSSCNSPPHQFGGRMSLEGVHQSSGMIEYSNQSDCVGGSQLGPYQEDYMIKSGSSSLSPLSTTSDGSAHSGGQSMAFNQGLPANKKRKYTDSPSQNMETLNPSLLNQQYTQMMQPIKQEPGILPSPNNPGGRGYFNDAYEMTETSNTIPVRLPQNHIPIPGPSHEIERSIPSSSQYSDSAYQVIKWSPFMRETWCPVYDQTGKELQTVSYRVDADKGFNFAVSDDTFVCQKKNHFQVTVHIGVVGHPVFIKTEDGIKQIEAFYINLYGVKYESQNQTISIEQSQSDRSKKAFHPVKVDLPGDQVTKVTIGRLHFSETTTNNMRKKGRPNPDQRYFMCIVALYAQSGGKSYTIAAAGTEKIIVRASNPGQFDQDDLSLWQRAHLPDAIYHHGRVGINYDHPDEALVVHGNLKLTGHLMQPSDQRAKQDIEEVDTKKQLENVSNIRICSYRYSPEYAMYAGIDSNRHETGIIAQEFAKVMPEAVRETGDVQLPNGETIPSFLVVDKDRLYMENVGAVKELCKLTGGFEERIDELERVNKKLARITRYDSFRSSVSGFTTPSASRAGSVRFANHSTSRSNGRNRSSGGNSRARKTNVESGGCMSHKLVQIMVVALVVIMAFSVMAMATLYILELKSDKKPNSTNDVKVSPTARNTTMATTAESIVIEEQTPPIRYCPSSNPQCFDETVFCCSDQPAGIPVEVKACSRTYRVDTNFLSELVDQLSTITTTTTIINGASIPARPQPGPRSWSGAPIVRVLHDGGSPARKLHVKHPKIKEGIEEYEPVEYDNPVKPPIIKVEDDENNVDGSSPVSQIEDKRSRDPKGKLKKFDKPIHEEMHEPVLRTVHNINKRSLNGRNATHDLADVVKSIVLLEPNVTLQTDQGSSAYVVCSKEKMNTTYNIPISSFTAPDTRIRIQFNLKEAASVLQCSKREHSLCGDVDSDHNDGPTEQKGSSLEFYLYFTNYVSVDYVFRITLDRDTSRTCQTPGKAVGKTFVEHRFHFYRTCSSTSSIPPVNF